MTVSKWPSNTRLAKKLNSVGKLIKVNQMTTWQLPGYAAAYAKEKYAKAVTKPAAELLVELVGDDPGRLCSEVDKLALYTEGTKTIRPEHVESLTGHNRMFNAFTVIDSVMEADVATAVERLRNMFTMERASEYTVVGALAWHFRRLFKAKALLQKGVDKNQAAKSVGVFRDWQKSKFTKQLDMMTLEQIGWALAELANIDYLTKTGQRQIQVVIEELVVELSRKLNSG